MAIREIQKSYEYICYVCGITHVQTNSNGHYTDSRPPLWARLIFKQARRDDREQECVDASVDLLLCPSCRNKVASALNALKPFFPPRPPPAQHEKSR